MRLRLRFRMRWIESTGFIVWSGFSGFTRHLRELNAPLATAIVREYPTARAFHSPSRRRLVQLCYDGRHQGGTELAQQLIEAAKTSIGRQHSAAQQPWQPSVAVTLSCEPFATH